MPRPLGASAAIVDAAQPLAGLTARESAIADLIARGLPNPAIAARLHLSVKTVANYVSIVVLKLGAANRAHAARIFRARRG